MLNILKTDLRRMFRSLSLWLTMAAVLLPVFLEYWISNYSGGIVFTLLTVLGFLPIFTGISVSLFVSSEFTCGFVKNTVNSVSRISWALSKFICAVINAVIYVIAALLFCVILGVAFFGVTDFLMVNKYMYITADRLLLSILAEILLQSGYAAVIAALAMITQNGFAGCCLGIASGLGLFSLVNQLLIGSNSFISRFILSDNMRNWLDLAFLGYGAEINGVPVVAPPEQPFIVGILWFIVSAVVSCIVIKNRDI